MKKIAKTIMAMVVVAVTLCSCSKSTQEKELELIDQVCAILDETTAENVDAMVEKMAKLEAVAKEISKTKSSAPKLSDEERAAEEAATKKLLMSMFQFSELMEGEDAEKYAPLAEKLDSIMNALGEH